MKPSDRAFQAAEKGPEPAAATDAMAGRNGIGRMSAVETAGIRRMRRIGDTCIVRRSKKFTGCGRAKRALFLVTGIRRKKRAGLPRAGLQEKNRSAARIEEKKRKRTVKKKRAPGFDTPEPE